MLCKYPAFCKYCKKRKQKYVCTIHKNIRCGYKVTEKEDLKEEEK